jgi:hypothetical protein
LGHFLAMTLKPVDQLLRESIEALTAAYQRGDPLPPAEVPLLLAALQAFAPLVARTAAQAEGWARARQKRIDKIRIPDEVRLEQSAFSRRRLAELRAGRPKLSKKAACRVIASELGPHVPLGRVTKYLAGEK